MPELINNTRENWGTRAGFVLAAIGSAVGLGNLWGFPYKLYSNGGGAFLIPYFIGMVIIGVPMLILLLSLGHMTQKAAPDAFRSIARKSEVIGWMGIFLGFVICTYYAVILAWCLKYLIISVQGVFNGGDLPWSGVGIQGAENAEKYFFTDTLNMWGKDHTGPSWLLGALSSPMVMCLVATWIMIFLCICRGVKLVSKVVLWTVPLPWLILVILVIRGLTLEGSAAGLEFYLRPDWGQLARPATWRLAFSQVFFSMSLCFGIMVAYASFLHRKSDINNNALIIGLGDLATSFIAGIAVFATLGGMAAVTGSSVAEAAKGGVSLAFVVFPYALAQLPHSAWFSTIFFFALITLGIDSAFSIVEGILAALVDKLRCSRLLILTILCAVSCAIGLVYCTRGGLGWLGEMDNYINGPTGLVFVGLLQCLVLGWGYRIARLRHHANERSDWQIGPWWDWLVRLVIPLLLSALFIWTLLDTVTTPDFFHDGTTLNLPHVIWVILAIAGPVLAIALSSLHDKDANIYAEDRPQTKNSRKNGAFGLAFALISLLLIALAFTFAVKAQRGYTTADGLNQAGFDAAISTWRLLIGAGIPAIIALVSGMLGVVASEANRLRPSRLARGSAAISVLSLGSLLGLAVSLLVMHRRLDASASLADSMAITTGRLSGMSYAIVAITLLIIFGGLMWCLYMAVKAANYDGDAQIAEDPAETEMS